MSQGNFATRISPVPVAASSTGRQNGVVGQFLGWTGVGVRTRAVTPRMSSATTNPAGDDADATVGLVRIRADRRSRRPLCEETAARRWNSRSASLLLL